MRTNIFLFVIILILSCNYNKINKSNIVFTHNSYKGTLFNKSCIVCWLGLGRNIKVYFWEPAENDIEQFEYNLSTNISHASDSDICYLCDKDDIDYIIKNLNDYNRQYAGYKVKGKKYILVNFYHAAIDQNFTFPDSVWYTSLGGGSYYFQLHYDVTNNRIFNMSINSNM